MLKREFAGNPGLELSAEQEAEAQRLADAVAVKTKEELLRITRLLVSRGSRAFGCRRSSRFATSSTRSAPGPSRPPSTSGKKGLPRVEHDLPALRRGGQLRGLSQQRRDESAGVGATGTSLLPLRQLRPGTLPLGPDAAHGRLSLDARRPRGGEPDGHPREFWQGGGRAPGSCPSCSTAGSR